MGLFSLLTAVATAVLCEMDWPKTSLLTAYPYIGVVESRRMFVTFSGRDLAIKVLKAQLHGDPVPSTTTT